MNLPKLRFKEFNSEWVETFLDEIVELYSGLTYSPDDVVNEEGTLVLRSSNVQSGEIVDADNVYVNTDIVNSEFVSKGDIIVVVRNGSRNLIGKHAQIKEHMDNTVIGAFMTGIRAKEPNFVNVLLDTKQFQKEINKNLGATINQITNGALKQMSFKVPSSSKEQSRIGLFFRKIDEKIQLQQEKIDLLKEQKKGFMQKIFSQELRFKNKNGYDFPNWKTNKLSHFLTEHKVRNYEGKFIKNDVLSVSGEYGVVNQIKFQGRSFAGESVSNYHVVHKGDIVYTKSPLKSNPYGIIKCNKGDAGIVSTMYAVYSCENTINGEFLDYYFQLDDHTNSYLRPLVNKGAKNDMKVNNQTVLSGTVTFPSISEQEKIVAFLNKLDVKILLSEQKLNKLQSQKKYFMQQMFI